MVRLVSELQPQKEKGLIISTEAGMLRLASELQLSKGLIDSYCSYPISVTDSGRVRLIREQQFACKSLVADLRHRLRDGHASNRFTIIECPVGNLCRAVWYVQNIPARNIQL